MKLENALIVYNKPLYQILILEEKNAYYRKLLKTKHPSTHNWVRIYDQHRETLEGVYRTLMLLGIRTKEIYRKELKKIGPSDLVVTVGGDGTVLDASHLMEKQLLMGVNAAPIDSRGALCHTRLETFLTAMVDLMTGVTQPIKVPRLKIQVGKKVLPTPALNEVLFANRSPGGTSRYLFQLGSRKEEHKGSGVWISTGAGSTAAMRSAGGKALKPNFPGMQYWVREPIMTSGPKPKLLKGVLPKGKRLTLMPTTRQSAVFVDGNHIEVPVEYGEKVIVSSNFKPLKMVW